MSLATAIQSVEKWISAEAVSFESGFTSFLNGIEPTLANDASTIIQGVITTAINAGVDLATGLPVGKLLTAVISIAEVVGKSAITAIEPTALTAIANIHLAGAIATQTAAAPQAEAA